MTSKPHRKGNGFEVFTAIPIQPFYVMAISFSGPCASSVGFWDRVKSLCPPSIGHVIIYRVLGHGKFDVIWTRYSSYNYRNTCSRETKSVCCFLESLIVWRIIQSQGHLCFNRDRKSHVRYFPFDEQKPPSTCKNCLCPFLSFPSTLLQGWHPPKSCRTKHEFSPVESRIVVFHFFVTLDRMTIKSTFRDISACYYDMPLGFSVQSRSGLCVIDAGNFSLRVLRKIKLL